MSERIDVLESVYADNEKRAADLGRELTARNVFCVNVMGAPGVGKTTVLTCLIKELGLPAFVIEGDITSDIDTRKLTSLGIAAKQINTNGACHLDASVIAKALEDVDFANGLLFIENIGNLICPVGFSLGEHAVILLSCVTEGGDKPWKYPAAFEKADLILLNKCDLLPYVDFDMEFYSKGVRKLNPVAPVHLVSGKTGHGFDEVIKWLRTKVPVG